MWLYYSNLKRKTTHWFLKFHRVWSWEFADKASNCLSLKALDWQAATHHLVKAFMREDRWLRYILPVVNLQRSEVHLLRIIAWAGKQDVTMATSVGINAHLCSCRMSASGSGAGSAQSWQTCAVSIGFKKHSITDSININLRKDILWHLCHFSPENPLCITSIRPQWQRLKQRRDV